ncbi:MAG: vWA domain-containing protein [Myxococcota bacterium]
MGGARRLGILLLGLALGGCRGLAGPAASDPTADALRDALDAEAERGKASAVALPAPERRPGEVVRELWLEVEKPAAEPTPVVRTGWVEVAGYAGSRENGRFDVVIVLDVSGSTQYASGADVDGDGVVGERRRRIEPWRVFDPDDYCSDPGDTVLDAELVATRRLVERLDPHRTRIGLVAFSDLPRPRAPLGSSRELLDLVLDDLSGAFGAGPTNLAEATRLAVRMLRETGEDPARAPEPVVLILSDGYPTHPVSEERAAAEALAAADEAALAGVRVTSLTLGLDEPRDPDVFAQMARRTGGEHLRVVSPGDVVQALPTIDLARVAGLEIVNATSGERARATRVRPDGHYDAWVRLRPGENRLVVTARGHGGATRRAERVVVYDDGAPPDPAELARIQKAIELRTLEIELEREVREARQRRVLTIEPDPEAVR